MCILNDIFYFIGDQLGTSKLSQKKLCITSRSYPHSIKFNLLSQHETYDTSLENPENL